MKRYRVPFALALTAGALALALRWSAGRAGFATPAACLDAYGEACLAGDAAGCLSCLGEPLRSEVRRQFPDQAALAEALRQNLRGVKAWVRPLEPAVEGAAAAVDVDEVRPEGNRRLRFRLHNAGGGWLIVGIDPPRDVPAVFPYGTHVSGVPEGPARPGTKKDQ